LSGECLQNKSPRRSGSLVSLSQTRKLSNRKRQKVLRGRALASSIPRPVHQRGHFGLAVVGLIGASGLPRRETATTTQTRLIPNGRLPGQGNRRSFSFDNLGIKCYFGRVRMIKVEMVPLANPCPAGAGVPHQSWSAAAMRSRLVPTHHSTSHSNYIN
jgi:hypothetical protein